MKNLLFVLLIALTGFNLQAQDLLDTIMVSGEARRFRVHLPNDVAPTKPVPVVMAFHGLGDNMNNFSNIGFSPLSDADTFIVVYPQASNLPGLGAGWRIGTPLDGGISDVDFVAAMLDTLRDQYMIDDDRVYATGFSMGGFMSHLLACELNDQIAAIAPHSGTMGDSKLSSCTGALVTPVLHLHGTSDQTIMYEGGNFSLVFPYQGARDMTDLWAGLNDCNATPDSMAVPDRKADGYTIDQFTYNNCKDNSEVLLFRINGFPHNWMFANNDTSSSELIWEFFKRHKLSDRSTPNTGVEDIREAVLQVYPNPTVGQFRVVWSEVIPQQYNLVVYNALGKALLQQTFVNNRTVDLSAFPKGMYLLRLEGKVDHDITLTKKILLTN